MPWSHSLFLTVTIPKCTKLIFPPKSQKSDRHVYLEGRSSTRGCRSSRGLIDFSASSLQNFTKLTCFIASSFQMVTRRPSDLGVHYRRRKMTRPYTHDYCYTTLISLYLLDQDQGNYDDEHIREIMILLFFYCQIKEIIISLYYKFIPRNCLCHPVLSGNSLVCMARVPSNCLAKDRLELEQNEDLNIVHQFVCLSVCVLSDSSCLQDYFWLHFRYYFQLHFRVLLQSEKGIAMHSLCETSCPQRTVH